MDFKSLPYIVMGGFSMKYVITAILCILIAFIIKVDLQEGAINYTKFKETISCEETFDIDEVRVKIQEGDTIYSLFATTSSPVNISFIERLTQFYQLNPHLKNQSLIPGEYVYVPIVKQVKEECSDK